MKKITKMMMKFCSVFVLVLVANTSINASEISYEDRLIFAPPAPDGFVVFDNIGGNPVEPGQVFLACGSNQVEQADISYRLFFAPSSQGTENPTEFTEYTFGSTAGDGGGTAAFGFVMSGLDEGVEYNFFLYQFDSSDDSFSPPAIATETAAGEGNGGGDPDPTEPELEIVQDFEDASSFDFLDFEGLAGATIEAAPTGDNGNSLRLESAASGQPFQGAFVNQLNTFLDLTDNKTVQVDVYATQAFNLLFKVENGGPDAAASQSYTEPNTWQTLTFTMDESLDGTGVANGIYQRFVVFPNWNDADTGFNAPPANFTVYLDNIRSVASTENGGGGEPGEIGNESVTVDASATWLGFANVFNLPGVNDGVFIFASPWGIADIRTDINTDDSNLTLYPNFSTYADNPGDDFWINPTTGEGNKIFEGVSFVESTALAGNILEFKGNVESFTISSDYEVEAFIRVFNADFSFNKAVVQPLTGTGEFELLYDDVDLENDVTVQYGFAVRGVNANPANLASLGNVVVGPTTLSSTEFETIELQLYPNPVSDVLHIKSATNFSSVELYNINGKLVTKQQNVNTIDMRDFANGMYILKLTSNGNSITRKVIKK